MSAIKPKKTPATVLQELTTKCNSSPPSYELISCHNGMQENKFHYIVNVMGVNASGKGRSKKDAKQITASNALTKLKEEKNVQIDENFSYGPSNEANDDTGVKPFSNYIGQLGDICYHNHIESPKYVEVSAVGPAHARIFTCECHIGDSMMSIATERTKKLAKQVCAKQLFERLKKLYPDVPNEDNISISDKTAEALEVFHESPLRRLNLGLKLNSIHTNLLESLVGKESMLEDADDYKNWFEPPLDEEKFNFILEKKNLRSCFEDLSEDAPTKIIALEVVGDYTFSTLGIGATIDIAKNMALDKMFKVLKTTFLDI